jgi:succinoglycan biosynthesis transport protein ExoP
MHDQSASRRDEFVEDETRGFSLNLAEIRSMIYRQRYIVGAALAVTLTLGLVVTLLMRPVYRASASIQIDQGTSNIIEGQDVAPDAAVSDTQRYLQTQTDILKSRALAKRVADKLQLASNDNFLLAMNNQPSEGNSSLDVASARREQIVATLQDNLRVTMPFGSRIVQISFDSPDPALAAKIANAYAENLIVGNMERKFETTAYARTFLAEELARAKIRLEQSERAAIAYSRSARIIDASDAAGTSNEEGKSGPKSLTTASLVQMNTDLSSAQTERVKAEQRWRQAQATPLMSLPEVLANSTIQNLQGERAEKRAAYQQVRQRYKEGHPETIRAATEVSTIDRQISQLATQIRDSIRDTYLVTQRTEDALSGRVTNLKSDSLEEQNRRVQLNLLSREADTNRSLYDGLLQRYKEVSAAAGIAANNISIVDRADVPPGPISPRLFYNMALAMLAGLVLAFLLAAAREMFDDTVRSPEDVDRKLALPLLGITPSVATVDVCSELANPRSALSEAYYSIRSSVEYSTPSGIPASVLVTSSRPSEGKSTTSSALALDFARLGHRTLLVDGDLRVPSLHREMKKDNSVGFVNVLTRQVSLDQAIQQIEGTGLHFLSSGPIPPNPAQLLSGNAVAEFLEANARNYDIILIDGPPVMGLADAPLLSRVTQATVFVVEADRANRGQVKTAIRRLRDARAKLIGVVLAKYDSSKVGYGDYYGYDYSYGNDTKKAA